LVLRQLLGRIPNFRRLEPRQQLVFSVADRHAGRFLIMHWLLNDGARDFLIHYGYWAIAGLVALECMGLPVPGESALVAAAIYAGSTHGLKIQFVIAAAALGVAVGGTIGYWLGRGVSAQWLIRYGSYIHLSKARINLGRYLFWRHGGKVVFLSRFIAILRSVAGVLAGLNRMPWNRFLAFNLLGGVLWAASYGFGAYALGNEMKRLSTPIAVATLAVAVIAVVAVLLFLHKHEQQLQKEADKRFPALS
jgi:membrane protein DedA with SNARE-associated domain